MNNHVGYYLVIDPNTRIIEARKKAQFPPMNRNGKYWAKVERRVWKQYRAGDIVSPGDLSGYDLQRLASW